MYICIMEIANIVSSKKLNVGSEFNVVENIDEIVFKDLPTLIIGYDEICDLYGEENVNVLKRNVTKNVFWTFKRTTKRQLYDTDLESFIRHSYKKATSKLNYVDLDLIQFSNGKILKIVKHLLTLNDVISYESENSVIYIYSNNITFGIDLNLVEYIGFDADKVRKRVKDKSIVYLEGEEILIEFQNHLERLDNDIKLIPFLYSINPYE